MADKIREAAFSALWSLGVQPRIMLDLYAGSGSIGIEALSRGAEHVDFVEQARDAVGVIRHNLDVMDFAEQAEVHQMTVERFVDSARRNYDFVVMDPPYADPDIQERVEQLSRSAAVEEGTVLLIGHAPYLKLPERVGRFMRVRERCHGDSCFSIFEISGEQDDDVVEREET
jgi:16S rRNA (guanine966-N2)-methyltransferase